MRVMVEFWADGPKSETPPGHWNVLANKVGDELGTNLQIGGSGPQVDRLEWDVKTYLALNGAVHDAAIAAWGLKGHYDSVRPISMIRYMGSLGQSIRSGRAGVRPRRPAARAGPHRGHHRRDDRAGRAPRGPRRPRGRDRHPRLGRRARRPEDTGQWGPVDPGRPVGALPAADVRDAGIPGVRLRSQHVQPGRGRGHDRHDRQRVLPRRHQWLHDPGRLAQERDGPDERHQARVGDLLRRRRPGRSVADPRWDPYRSRRFNGRQIGSECGLAAWARAQLYYAGTVGS